MKRFHFILVFALIAAVSLVCPAGAGDATSFNPVPVTVTAKTSGGVPVGTIIAWPVTSNPSDWDKWLECTGQSISPTVYPELFALTGGVMPDLRGKCLHERQGSGPQGNLSVRVEISSGGQHNDGVTGVYVGGIGTETWKHGGHSNWSSSGTAIIPLSNLYKVRYLIRARP